MLLPAPQKIKAILNELLEGLKEEALMIPESTTQNFSFTLVLATQTHSRLRNYFSD